MHCTRIAAVTVLAICPPSLSYSFRYFSCRTSESKFTNINHGFCDQAQGCKTRVSARPSVAPPPLPPRDTRLASPLLFYHTTSQLPLQGVHRSASLPIPCLLFRRTPMECKSVMPSWRCGFSARPPVHTPPVLCFLLLDGSDFDHGDYSRCVLRCWSSTGSSDILTHAGHTVLLIPPRFSHGPAPRLNTSAQLIPLPPINDPIERLSRNLAETKRDHDETSRKVDFLLHQYPANHWSEFNHPFARKHCDFGWADSPPCSDSCAGAYLVK